MKARTTTLCFALLLLLPACAALTMSIQEAKPLADTSPVTLSGQVVTYASADFFYIEVDSRAMGIRVEKQGHGLTVGMRADITGAMATKPDSRERYIVASAAVQTSPPSSTGTISPVSMSVETVGGGNWSVVGTGGQQGVASSVGLNNIGQLVRVCGQYHQIDATTFTVSDGSGPSVLCAVPTGTFLSSTWQFVVVTGISSMYDQAISYQPLLLVRDINVILPVEAVSNPGTPAGDTTPLVNLSYAYSTTGSTCSQGHPVEYSFNWGDGTSSSWSTSTTASHAWSSAGTKTVTVTARCQTHPSLTSTSAGRTVTVVTQLAASPWPMFRHDTKHSGVSPYHDPASLLTAWSRSIGNGYSSPSVGPDGTIYISGTGSLYALNPDGSVKWSKTINESTRSTPAIGSDGTIYIGANGLLYAFTSAGTQKWTFAVSGDVTSSPLIGPDGTVYIGVARRLPLCGYTRDIERNPEMAIQHRRYAHDFARLSARTERSYTPAAARVSGLSTPPPGAQKWQHSIGVSMTSSAALSPDGSTVYIGAYDGNMYSVNASTGAVNWQVPVGFVNAS